MLLYWTFWIRRRDSCPPARFAPIYARMDSLNFIHHQTSAWHRDALAKKNLLSHPGLSPSAPAGSSGSDSRRRRQLRITAAACRRRAGRKPSSNPAVPSVRKMVCARQREAGGNLSYPSLSLRSMYSLTIALVILLSCSRVPGAQGWNVIECFPPCCRLQHNAKTDSFRHKQDASHYWGSTKSSIW